MTSMAFAPPPSRSRSPSDLPPRKSPLLCSLSPFEPPDPPDPPDPPPRKLTVTAPRCVSGSSSDELFSRDPYLSKPVSIESVSSLWISAAQSWPLSAQEDLPIAATLFLTFFNSWIHGVKLHRSDPVSSLPTARVSPPRVSIYPHLGRYFIRCVLSPPLCQVTAPPNQKDIPRIHLVLMLGYSRVFTPPPLDALSPHPTMT